MWEEDAISFPLFIGSKVQIFWNLKIATNEQQRCVVFGSRDSLEQGGGFKKSKKKKPVTPTPFFGVVKSP
jgi:hypothetical protein